MKTLLTLSLILASSFASAASIAFDFEDQDGDNKFNVSVVVGGDDNNGLATYNVQLVGLDTLGINNSAITWTPATLSNLRSPDFAPTGFTAPLMGPVGSKEFSAAQSQFQVANPVIGIGKVEINIAAAVGPPNNNPIVLGVPAVIGVLDLGTSASFTDDQLRGMFKPNAALLNPAGGSSNLVALDPSAITTTVTREATIPEPTTCILAGLALVGAAARRRV